MKQFTLYLLGLLCSIAAQANPGPKPANASAALESKALANTGAIRFQFNQIAAGIEHKDSVLIIFDRCDRTGAGIVYQVYAADSAKGITIPEVPAGKYFVTIQCLGLHRDRMEKKVVIKSKKNEKVNLALTDSEEFSKENVVIPAYRTDLNHMTVLK
jgi:hypothetical protein